MLLLSAYSANRGIRDQTCREALLDKPGELLTSIRRRLDIEPAKIGPISIGPALMTYKIT